MSLKCRYFLFNSQDTRRKELLLHTVTNKVRKQRPLVSRGKETAEGPHLRFQRQTDICGHVMFRKTGVAPGTKPIGISHCPSDLTQLTQLTRAYSTQTCGPPWPAS